MARTTGSTAGRYTDPNLDWSYLQAGRDDTVGTFVTLNAEKLGDPIDIQLATHLIGDPQFQGKGSMALTFRCRGGFTADGLKVSLTEDDWGPRSRRSTATVSQSELGPGWRELVLPLSRFTGPEGRPPAGWKACQKLEIEGKAARRNPPRFARFRWADPKKLP